MVRRARPVRNARPGQRSAATVRWWWIGAGGGRCVCVVRGPPRPRRPAFQITAAAAAAATVTTTGTTQGCRRGGAATRVARWCGGWVVRARAVDGPSFCRCHCRGRCAHHVPARPDKGTTTASLPQRKPAKPPPAALRCPTRPAAGWRRRLRSAFPESEHTPTNRAAVATAAVHADRRRQRSSTPDTRAQAAGGVLCVPGAARRHMHLLFLLLLLLLPPHPQPPPRRFSLLGRHQGRPRRAGTAALRADAPRTPPSRPASTTAAGGLASSPAARHARGPPLPVVPRAAATAAVTG